MGGGRGATGTRGQRIPHRKGLTFGKGMESSDTRCNNNTRHSDYGRRPAEPRGRSTIYTREANKRGN
eukprot:795884-Pleurochrysis_carterae.AAC.1